MKTKGQSANPSHGLAASYKRWREAASRVFEPQIVAGWPLPYYLLCMLGVFAVTVALLWLLWLSDSQRTLEAKQAQEQQLRAELARKVHASVQAKQQYERNRGTYAELLSAEQVLPHPQDMSLVLDTIGQSATGRGLRVEMLRPQATIAGDYYTEQPIALRLHGSFSALNAFAQDMVVQPFLINYHSFAIQSASGATPSGKPSLSLEATIKTWYAQNQIAPISPVQTKPNTPAPKATNGISMPEPLKPAETKQGNSIGKG